MFINNKQNFVYLYSLFVTKDILIRKIIYDFFYFDYNYYFIN